MSSTIRRFADVDGIELEEAANLTKPLFQQFKAMVRRMHNNTAGKKAGSSIAPIHATKYNLGEYQTSHSAEKIDIKVRPNDFGNVSGGRELRRWSKVIPVEIGSTDTKTYVSMVWWRFVIDRERVQITSNDDETDELDEMINGIDLDGMGA